MGDIFLRKYRLIRWGSKEKQQHIHGESGQYTLLMCVKLSNKFNNIILKR